MVIAAATLRDWVVEAADVEGAYLTAPIRGDATYMRLPPHLWEAAGVPPGKLAGLKDPVVKLDRALYGLPRSGFDWFSHCDEVLTKKLGWERLSGSDSVYVKGDAVLAVYVDDIVMAGTPHARRREWKTLQEHLTLRGEPEKLDRFLGAKYDIDATSKFTRVAQVGQPEYTRKIIQQYNDAAPFPAGRRTTPAAKGDADTGAGQRAGDCRTFIGSLMYLSRTSRPDITYATNALARHVASWEKSHDKSLEQLMGYLNATSDARLQSTIDVRDAKGDVWLEMWVDADHAGDKDRHSTSGWVLLLKGEYGTSVPIDWGSKKQGTVARSSGEAETVALDGAIKRIAGVNKGLCASSLPAMDILEKLLKKKVPLAIMVDASVAKTAITKGSTRAMKYLSKAQEIDLFWLREMVEKLGIDVKKTPTVDNIADLLTKPLCGSRTEELSRRIGMRAE